MLVLGPMMTTGQFEEISLTGTVLVRDLWARRDLGNFNGEFSIGVPEHEVTEDILARMA